ESSFILNYFGGPEQDNDTKSMRHFFDMSFNHELTESVALGANYDYGIEQDTTNAKNIFTGAGLYVTYKPEKRWSLAFRADVFEDRSGIQTGSGLPHFTLQGYTLTPQWELTKNLLIRSDLRIDAANAKVYPTDTDFISTQPTITLNAVYHF
ncbi:MAG: outer membrane beta-barrel protein, partial [bacterium]|nr:outer membrane beta-barrel protein [bacterium]